MAAPMSPVLRRLPVVVILGATGTGKSKLALQIGAKYGGEIISADSMQVYKGLDIITNKVSADEQSQCPHHVIDFLNPLSRYTVVDFRSKALPVVERLLRESRLPVIVGGTNYYIEALLWKVLVNTQPDSRDLLLDANGDPVSLTIRRKCPGSSQTASAAARSPRRRDDDPLRSPEIPGSPSDSVGTQSGRVCEAEAPARDSSVLERRPDVARSALDDPLSAAGRQLNQPLQSDPNRQSNQPLQSDPNRDPIRGDLKRDQRQGNERGLQRKAADAFEENDSTPGELPPFNAGEDAVSQPNRAGDPSGHGSPDEMAQDLGSSEGGEERDGELMTIDVEAAETETLYEILADVDPSRAQTLHPNNRRKIIRSLQVYEQLGQPHSHLLSAQRETEGGGPLGGPLRFPDVCIFWLQCDLEALDRRLDARVEAMMGRGLLDELIDFHQEYNRQRVDERAESDTLYTQGIFQSIGFKEFHPYLILPPEVRVSDRGRELLEEGVAKLKTATRQYARRQNRWVRNRFIRRPGRNVPPVFALSSTDPSLWDQKVLQPALAILQALREGNEPPVSPLEDESSLSPAEEAAARYVCEICDGRVFVGKQQWLGHLKSRRHYKKARKLKRASLLKSLSEGKELRTELAGREADSARPHDGDR